MKINNEEIRKLLVKHGWREDRNVPLPVYLDNLEIPLNVKQLISNIYGLEIVDKDGYKRIFKVKEENLKYLEELAEEHLEDTGLSSKFYHIGEMSEYPGSIAIDEYGRFFLINDSLVYCGDCLESFLGTVAFGFRCGLTIAENGSTLWTYNNQDTGYKFDTKEGWLGEDSSLTWDVIKG